MSMKVSTETSVWERLAPYLDQALELEPRERAAWLRSLAETEPEIAASVRDLLSRHAELDEKGFMLGSPLPMTRLDDFLPVMEQAVRERIGLESGDWLQDAGRSGSRPPRSRD
jgi:hypothetical protein